MVVIVVTVAGSGSGPGEPVPAPPLACVERWNGDADARAAGRHNSIAHGYSAVQVTHLTPELTETEDPGAGTCAVIFARSSLDPEPGAAAQILRGESWFPLSRRSGVEPDRLAELQSRALELANAELRPDGTIVGG